MYVLVALAASITLSLTVSAHVTCAVDARGECGRPLNVIAFSGSLRKASVNQGLLRFAQSVGGKYDLNITIISTQLPLYNGDLEAAGIPDEVRAFRNAIESADCLLLGVEEYNFSFSGVMKNALDWASRLIEGKRPLVGKLVGMMGSGGGMGGARAQYHLRQVRPSFSDGPVRVVGWCRMLFLDGGFWACRVLLFCRMKCPRRWWLTVCAATCRFAGVH
jgi:NAD(P)H-dependent FMN reductase